MKEVAACGLLKKQIGLSLALGGAPLMPDLCFLSIKPEFIQPSGNHGPLGPKQVPKL